MEYYAEKEIQTVMSCFVCRKHDLYDDCTNCYLLNGDCYYSAVTPRVIHYKNFVCCHMCKYYVFDGCDCLMGEQEKNT